MLTATAVGNLTKDPEEKFSKAGKPYCTFSIAVNRGQDKTTFVDCICFDAIADQMKRFFKKGKPIAVTGKLEARAYTSAAGEARYGLSITIGSWDFISVGRQGEGGQQAPATPQPYQQQPSRDVPDAPDINDPFADS